MQIPLTATEVQNRFKSVLKRCLTEAVIVKKHQREVAAILNIDEYHRLIGMDERYWGEFSLKAIDDGFMDDDEFVKWITEKI